MLDMTDETAFKDGGVKGREYRLLDCGFIRVVDIMGSDEGVVQAARVSYGLGTKTTSEDRALIRYLLRNQHMSPFEMCEIKLHIKLPQFIAKQLLRHRTASVNELSERYSIAEEDAYAPRPQDLRRQGTVNKQGAGAVIDPAKQGLVTDLIADHITLSQTVYQHLISEEIGLARETARIVLPSARYTALYFKIDLRNLLHLIKLRIHSSAQPEIRLYAEKLLLIVKDWCPYIYEAFLDYDLHTVTFSRQELKALISSIDEQKVLENLKNTSMDKKERARFLKKLSTDVTLLSE